MQKPDLSIIIPVYNGQDYVARCMNSILRQRESSHYEIIVINDGSTDNTPSILADFTKHNDNIHVINQKNSGVSISRNNGINASHGKYITFVDCDDMVGLNFNKFKPYFMQNPIKSRNLENLSITTIAKIPIQEFDDSCFCDTYFTNMISAANDTNADVVFGGKITINPDDFYTRHHIYTNDVLYTTTPSDKDTILKHADIRENANFALYKRDFLDFHKLRFLANMQLDEDILFCMLAAFYAKRVATVQDVTYFYNRHTNTLSNIIDNDEKTNKYKIADIRRFSVLLTEIHKKTKYAQLETLWLKEFARKGSLYSDNLREFPPLNCHKLCSETTCTGCFVADAMYEQFLTNIAKYFQKTK